MSALTEELEREIGLLAGDRTSGASDILGRALAILNKARAGAAPMREVAMKICRAQPTMAPVWNAALAALSSDENRLSLFVQRTERATSALARFATACFDDGANGSLHIVTISFSRSVLVALDAIRTTRPLHVSCSESRPALEGRHLASELASAGVRVVLFSDAAIGEALSDADAVLVGADAVAPSSFLNKAGTRMLCAAAAQRGVPVHVAATRDKFVGAQLAARLQIRHGDPDEIWRHPPAGVEVHNPYFESTPLDLVASVVTDAGVLGAGMIPDVCASVEGAEAVRLLESLDL